jgi:hypothetical protein
LIGELKAVDTIVIGAPMYNFGIPSKLNAWFDYLSVLQPDYEKDHASTGRDETPHCHQGRQIKMHDPIPHPTLRCPAPPLSRRRVQTQARAETCLVELLINLSFENRCSFSYNFNELTILLTRQAFGLPGDLEQGVVRRSHVFEMSGEPRFSAAPIAPPPPSSLDRRLAGVVHRQCSARGAPQIAFDRAMAIGAGLGDRLGAASVAALSGVVVCWSHRSINM